MFVHLPIVIMAVLMPVSVSDTVPKFDITRECHLEGGLNADYDRCSEDEGAALRDLQKTWPQFAASDKRNCIASTTIGGFSSYVELLVCLQIARDVNDEHHSPGEPLTTDAVRPHASGVTAGIGHDPITPGQMPSQGSR